MNMLLRGQVRRDERGDVVLVLKYQSGSFAAQGRFDEAANDRLKQTRPQSGVGKNITHARHRVDAITYAIPAGDERTIYHAFDGEVMNYVRFFSGIDTRYAPDEGDLASRIQTATVHIQRDPAEPFGL
jgi:hypothetical protein